MSVIAVRAVGLTENQTALVLLSLTLVAIVMSFVWGYLADRIGAKTTLIAGPRVVGGGTRARRGVAFVEWRRCGRRPVPSAVGLRLFLVAGAILGSGLGGVQVADRVLMVHLSPAHRVGEFFGIYGLVGKASQVVGQLLYGADRVPDVRLAGRGGVPARGAVADRDDAHRRLAHRPAATMERREDAPHEHVPSTPVPPPRSRPRAARGRP